MRILDAEATATALPWTALVDALRDTIAERRAGGVSAPARVSLPITSTDVWLMMPAWSRGADVAACKLITVHAGNPARGLPMIQGDVVVIRSSTGERLALLDGPTVTGRRTAAVTLLALQSLLARRPPAASLCCLIVGCGVQGRNHLDALATLWPQTRFLLHSRSPASAQRLADDASAAGRTADVVTDVEAVLAACDLVILCTPALRICLPSAPQDGAIIAAIGAFTPTMAEVAPAIVHALGRNILLDTPDAVHEAGDLLGAGVDPDGLPTLLDEPDRWPLAFDRTVLFKSCGSALWDLSAARVLARPPD